MKNIFSILVICIIPLVSIKGNDVKNDNYSKNGEKLMEEGKYDEAISNFEKGCVNKEAQSCALLAGIYMEGAPKHHVNGEKALSFWIQSCNLGDAEACAQAAQIYENGFKSKEGSVQKDISKAEIYNELACKAGFTVTCKN